MKNRSSCWALVAATGLFLAGCGGGDGADGIIGTGANEPIKLVGAAQKGPYLKGSQVLLSRLLADGTPSPETTRTEIEDDLGNFRYSVTQTGPVLISADGYHFNELTGKLSQNRLQLNAVYNVTDATEQHSYVNILTHLAYKRALKLIREGKAVDDAIHQAESEVLTAFNPVLPVSGIRDFTQLNLFDLDSAKSAGNAYVLALSATIYEYATQQVKKDPDVPLDSQLASLLNGLADDLSDDGAISRADILTGLKDAIRLLRPDEIRKNLESRSFVATNEKLPVANMDMFIDTDGDGQTNSVDTDDDNDGIPDEVDTTPYIYSEAPVLTKPDITKTLASNQVITFEWTSTEYAKEFQIQISKNLDYSNPVVSVVTDKNQLVTSLGADTYYLRIRSQNEFGSWGQWSTHVSNTLAVGVFQKRFSRGNYSSASDIVTRKNGNYLILGSASAPANSQTTNWIFELNQQGDIIWESEHFNPGTSGLQHLIELGDGSIVASGQYYTGQSEKNGLVVALGTKGEKIWDSTFTSAQIDTTNFFGITEVGGALYILSQGSCAKSDSTCQFPAPRLHKLAKQNGEILNSILLDPLKEESWEKIGSFRTTKNDKFLLGFSTLDNLCHDINNFGCRHAAFAVINSDGIIELTNPAGGWPQFDNVAIEAPWGGYAVAGTNLVTDQVIALFDPYGSKLASFNFGQRHLVAFDSKNLILGLGQHYTSSTYNTLGTYIRSVDQTGHVEEIRLPSLEVGQAVALAPTPDGGAIMLFTSYGSNKSIIVIRVGSSTIPSYQGIGSSR